MNFPLKTASHKPIANLYPSYEFVHLCLKNEDAFNNSYYNIGTIIKFELGSKEDLTFSSIKYKKQIVKLTKSNHSKSKAQLK